jgi:hypothetical protein
LLAGPAMAVGIQLWFSNREEHRRRKLGILDILTQYRGRTTHSDSVRPLNSIDVVYYDCPVVRSKFTALLNFLETDEAKAEGRRRDETDLNISGTATEIENSVPTSPPPGWAMVESRSFDSARGAQCGPRLKGG